MPCRRRAAEQRDAIAATDVDCHVTLPWEVMPIGDLISAKTGIIMHTLGDRTERVVATQSTDADRGRDPSFGKKAAADPAGNASITSE